ncbi:hypothetical protein EER27_04930 [Lysobacter psychrotolerans]|uniref:FecR protein domain-containing protein n=1 Tax=Montanilutibacter psychrotolerans TaxID=1327343 RepID=A0A3M8SUY1_9GAMM|nr:hypothetical protein EER27_04930 [Lysobacter psychrotolerans]
MAQGAVVEAAGKDPLRIAVARIGRIALSPGSRLRLLETRTGAHRVTLEVGHMRARIWAPPGHFRVADGPAEVVDLGCDFDVWKQGDGSGRVFVRSGWVAYRVGSKDVLVPAGFGMRFDARGPATPLRPNATRAFTTSVRDLENALTRADTSDGDMQDIDVTAADIRAAADRVAANAADTDAYTLLSLLTVHPDLAGTALYPRLARALRIARTDRTHRAGWIAGDQRAINQWWEKYPTQPKRWWTHWADALP